MENGDKPCNSSAGNLGLTKREYIAVKAMQALSTPCTPGGHNSNEEQYNTEKAVHAVALADALLQELEK